MLTCLLLHFIRLTNVGGSIEFSDSVSHSHLGVLGQEIEMLKFFVAIFSFSLFFSSQAIGKGGDKSVDDQPIYGTPCWVSVGTDVMINARAIGYISTERKSINNVIVSLGPLQKLNWEKKTFGFKSAEEAGKWVNSLMSTIKESCK